MELYWIRFFWFMIGAASVAALSLCMKACGAL